MSYEEDRLLLQQYEAWKELAESIGLVVTIERFLEDCQNVDNARRIEEALGVFDSSAMEGAFGDIMAPTRFEEQAIGVLRAIERILTDDRPYLVEQTFDDPVGKRVFT